MGRTTQMVAHILLSNMKSGSALEADKNAVFYMIGTSFNITTPIKAVRFRYDDILTLLLN